jgi:hypothetical protein
MPGWDPALVRVRIIRIAAIAALAAMGRHTRLHVSNRHIGPPSRGRRLSWP